MSYESPCDPGGQAGSSDRGASIARPQAVVQPMLSARSPSIRHCLDVALDRRIDCRAQGALAHWTTIDGANYARSEPLGLARVGDVPRLVAGFAGVRGCLGDAGVVPFVPAAATLAAMCAMRRRLVGSRRAGSIRRSTWGRGCQGSPNFPHPWSFRFPHPVEKSCRRVSGRARP